MRTSPCLAEDNRLQLQSDEMCNLHVDPPFADESCDWGSDPMEILMAKQERERSELQLYLDSPVH